jgi:hypothetical protein
VEEPPWGAEPRFERGPALQQAGALPTEPRRTLLSHAAPYWAMPHPTEPRRTLLSHAAPLTEPRRTLLSHATLSIFINFAERQFYSSEPTST